MHTYLSFVLFGGSHLFLMVLLYRHATEILTIEEKDKHTNEADMAQGHNGLTVMRLLWVRSPLGENELLFMNIFFSSLWHQGTIPALSSATLHAMLRKIRRMWDTECLN